MRTSVLPLLLMLLCGCDRVVPEERARIRAQLDSAAAMHKADSAARMARADSLRDGHHVYRDREGLILMEGDLLGGRRQGVWTSYERDGRVKSRTEYRDGQAHGLTVVFHPNGNLYYSGDNRGGHPVGAWRFFDTGGRLVRTVLYDSTGAQVPVPK